MEPEIPPASRGRTGILRPDVRPLYVQAEQAIRELISGRRLGPGARLPSEQEMARLLGISRPTVREALRKLELTGMVRRVHGLGTLVTAVNNEVAAGLEILESLDSQARREGWTCRTVELSLTACTLSADVAGRLGRDAGAPATWIQRVKTRDGRPIALMESTVPEDVLAHGDVQARFRTSIIDMFREHQSPAVDFALARVRVGAATADVAKKLKAAVGTPLLLLEEVFVSPFGDHLCFNVNYFVPGTIRLDVIRRFP